MSDLGSDVNPLDLLAEEFVTRYRRGERPSLDEFIARRPDLADDIRDLFPGLVVMEGVRPDREDATGPYAGGDGSAPAKLGDYRILREVGRGGMGVVYEAEQESLGRHVALKVLPAHSLLDPQRLRRFQREAKAAARLHHTNIVPVFGVGEANGLHYYVMQFIQGQGLDAVLVELMALRGVKTPTPAHDGSVSAAGSLAPRTAHRLYRAGDASAVDMARSLLTGGFATMAGAPTPEDDASPLPAPLPATSGSNSAINLPGQSDTSRLSETGRAFWQSVARIGVQAAEALAYAHAQGTLHRDVKPSNLLLDTQGTVWVTDFGLAKAADSEDLTQAGDIVGTIRYMAPERFQGKSDARSDVYGLGLTLYEMLALRPAFDASDRNRLLHQVTHEAPPRPRAVNRDVPRDLETVVLKAIARDPAHRYASAGEVAADLGRFLEDKPIRARRVGLAEQLWRWGRRNPVVAGLTAAVLLLLLLGTAASVVAAYYFSRLAASENKARADADRANNDIVARDVEIRRQTDEQREESERLKRAYAFHESGAFHAAQNEFDKTLADYTREIEERPDIGRFWLERGQLYLQFYCWHEAAADFAKGFDLQPPADLDMWVAHAQLRQYVGDREGYRRACAELLARYGQTPDRAVASALASACIAGPGALDDYSRPIQLLEKAVADASAHNESATPYKIALISLYYRAGRGEQAVRYFEGDAELQKTLPSNLTYHRAILAMARHGLGQDDQARKHLKDLDDDLTNTLGYVSLNGEDFNYDQYRLYYDLALFMLRREAHQGLGEPAPAEHSLHWLVRARRRTTLGQTDEAAADLTRVMAERPADWTLQLERGRVLARQHRWEDALADFEAVVKEHSDNARVWFERGRIYALQEKWDQAAADFSQGLEKNDLATPDSAVPPDVLQNDPEFAALARLRPRDARLWLQRAANLQTNGHPTDAIAAYGKAIDILPSAPEPYVRRAQINMAQEHWDEAAADSARVLDLAGDSPRQAHWATDLITPQSSLPPLMERLFKLRPDNGLLYATRARAHANSNECELALADFMEAVKRLPDDDGLRLERGEVYARVGRWKDAAVDYDRVVAVQQPFGEDWLRRDCLHALNGDDAGYRKQCAALAERYGKKPDDDTASYLAISVALRPGSLADPAPLVHWGEAYVAAYPTYAGALQALGLDHYRAGHFSEAERWCQESAKASPTWTGRALNWLVLALACQRMNQPAEARQWFDKATAWLDDVNAHRPKEQAAWLPPGMWLSDWLEYQILLREARTELNVPAPDGGK